MIKLRKWEAEDIAIKALAIRRVTFRLNVRDRLLLMSSSLYIYVAFVESTEMCLNLDDELAV